MKSVCLLVFLCILAGFSITALVLNAYTLVPAVDQHNNSPAQNNIYGPFWYVAHAVGVAGTGFLVFAIIVGIIYNCSDELDFLRFGGAIMLWVGAACCIAGTVLTAITLNSVVQATCFSTSNSLSCVSLCYQTQDRQFCNIQYFIGVCSALLGFTSFFSIFAGIQHALAM